MIYLQITSALVTIRSHIRAARRGELCGHGLLHNDTLHDAAICHHVHRMFPMEDEQGARLYHVYFIFCFCRRFPHVRVQFDQLSGLEKIKMNAQKS